MADDRGDYDSPDSEDHELSSDELTTDAPPRSTHAMPDTPFKFTPGPPPTDGSEAPEVWVPYRCNAGKWPAGTVDGKGNPIPEDFTVIILQNVATLDMKPWRIEGKWTMKDFDDQHMPRLPDDAQPCDGPQER